ncbi:MAG: hypothetical protein QOH39_2589 [Verrucomicrobiota bacterium]|jgi:hypothetical protein
MPLEDLLFRHRAIATAITLLSCFALYRAYRRGNLLSGVAGLHSSVLLFMGIGPFAYTYLPDYAERIGFETLFSSLVIPYTYFLVGYAIEVCLEQFAFRRKAKAERFSLDDIDVPTVFFFGFLSLVGYTFSLFEFTRSGVGTIFQVLSTFLYPVIVIAVIAYRPKDIMSNIVTLAVLGIAGYFAIFSIWRSQLIMLLGAVGIGAIFRSRSGFVIFGVLGIIILYVVLPFQQLKKLNSERFFEDPEVFFYASMDMSMENRNSLVTEFLGIRMNGARELAYVQAALDSGLISLRGGAGYADAALQLIPRLVWPSKPSFNQTTGFLLPREIELVSWDDPYTSWGVNFWAEIAVNYSYKMLLILVPIFFFGAGWVDAALNRIIKHQGNRWIATATLFFMFLQLVSIVNFVTYLLWFFLVIVISDHLSGSLGSNRRSLWVHENPALRGS